MRTNSLSIEFNNNGVFVNCGRIHVPMKCRKKKNIHSMDTGGRNDISPKLLEKTDSKKSFSSFSPKHTTRRFPPVLKELPVFYAVCRFKM